MHGTPRTPPLLTPGNAQASRLLVVLLAVGLALPAVAALAAGTDDNIPNATPLTWGQATKGDKNFRTDTDDVYRFDLKKNQRIKLGLTGASGTDFDLYLFPPTALNINDDQEVAASEHVGTSTENIDYTAPSAGAYYADVATWDTDGQYTLTGSVKPVISLKASTSVYNCASPKAITLSGVLDPRAASLNLKVTRRRAGASSYAPLKGFPGKSDGTYSYQIRAGSGAFKETADYRIEFAGATGYLAAQSGARTIKVKPLITLLTPTAARSILTSESVLLSGKLTAVSPISGIRVAIERYKAADKSWHELGTSLKTHSSGEFLYTFSSNSAGTFRLRARYTGSDARWIASDGKEFPTITVSH